MHQESVKDATPFNGSLGCRRLALLPNTIVRFRTSPHLVVAVLCHHEVAPCTLNSAPLHEYAIRIMWTFMQLLMLRNSQLNQLLELLGVGAHNGLQALAVEEGDEGGHGGHVALRSNVLKRQCR